MPALDDIIKFSQEICNSAAEHIEVIDFSGSSCCVLMAKEDYSWRKLEF